ncbi:MAG: CPBP family intramembrane metalloprotease [Candidatus Hydrogenedentes bacterium]|nr:CPBP family intramembrane metalloprotease [Candidatus Hydrogenedentota bacterium]
MTSEGKSRWSRGAPALVAAYVAAVLLVDTLVAMRVRTPIDWRVFSWTTEGGFDLFKFVAWFVIPFLICLTTMDWGWIGVARWKRSDTMLLAAIALLGMLAILGIMFIPALRDYYPSLSHRTWPEKWDSMMRALFWVASWLVGWEFLHRYFLVRPFSARWPRFGWLIVPVSEGAYHLQKHWAEMLLMVAFSVALTWWTVRRKNALLPFLAHLIIEVELIAFMVLV